MNPEHTLRSAAAKAEEEVLRGSEEHLRSLVENALDMITILEIDGTIRYQSPWIERVLGYQPGELVGKNAFTYMHPADAATVINALAERVRSPGTIGSAEFRFRHRDGSWRFLGAVGKVIDERSETKRVLISARDITERKQTEEKLNRLSNVVEMSTDSIVIADIEGNIVEANAATLKMYGTGDKEDLLGKNAFDFIAPEDRERAVAAMGETLEKGFVTNREYRVILKNGSTIPIEMNVSVMKDVDGKPIGFVGISRDITTHTQAEEALRESEERFRTLFENVPTGIYRTTPEGRILQANPALVEMLGYTSYEELAVRDLEKDDFFAPGYSRQEFRERIERDGEVRGIETGWRKRDNSVIFVRENAKAIRDARGTLLYYEGTVEDITERKQTEAALHDSEEKYRDLVENLNDVIYAQDEHGLMTYVSPVVAPLSGYTPAEIVGRSFTEFIHPDDLPALLASFQRTIAGQIEPSEFRVVTKSGAIRWARSSSRPILRGGRVAGLRGVVTDITDRKQAENSTKALLEVTKDISGTLALDELLDCVQRRTAAVLPCDMVATFYWDPTREVSRMISHYGIPTELLPEAEALAFPPNQPFGGRLANGQAVVINHVTKQPWLPAELLAHFHIAALMAVPLHVRGRDLGALVACTTTSGRRFETSQLELCHGIARQLAVGIETTELYRQQQEEAAIASILARVSQELIASLNTPEILERLCRLMTEALEGHCSYTLLWQAEKQTYVPVASWGLTPEQQETLQVLRIPPEAVTVLLTLLKTEDVTAVSSSVSSALLFATLLQPFAIKTALFLRLRRGTESIGFQCWGLRTLQALTLRHRRIAQGVAQVASMALANASLLTELQQANRIKDDFVSMMSHELRTPLSIIIGYNSLLREGTFDSLTAAQADTVRRIDGAARELLNLVNATLDLSRLQSQQVSLNLTEISMAELLEELEVESRQLSNNPAVRLLWQMPAALPLLRTDRLKLKMVLKNLITNALKFTEEGVITVTARQHGEGVEFCVSDTGTGMPQDALPTIFEPFQQLDSSSTRRYGGVGLGLYIVRQLLKLLGGTIAVESEMGKGSIFCIWIPTVAGQKTSEGNSTIG